MVSTINPSKSSSATPAAGHSLSPATLKILPFLCILNSRLLANLIARTLPTPATRRVKNILYKLHTDLALDIPSFSFIIAGNKVEFSHKYWSDHVSVHVSEAGPVIPASP
jgi:hypothetical protein